MEWASGVGVLWRPEELYCDDTENEREKFGVTSSCGESTRAAVFLYSIEDDRGCSVVSSICGGGVDCGRVEGGAIGRVTSRSRAAFADIGADLPGPRSTSCKTFLIALRSKPACNGSFDEEAAAGSLGGVDVRDGVGVCSL